MKNKNNFIDDFNESIIKDIQIKAKSFIITFFGDVVYPFGGTIWLGSLINFMKIFGINEKLTRTSIFRLTKEGWLSRKTIGRESYYSLSDYGIGQTKKVHYRVYAYETYDVEKSKDWLVLFTHNVETKSEIALDKTLKGEGFANPSKHLYFHTNYRLEYIKQILIRHKVENSTLLIKGNIKTPLSTEILKQNTLSYWDMKNVEKKYEDFLLRFREVYKLENPISEFSEKNCFILRILLIHEYRRALLYDPNLGNDIINIDWLGKSVTSLVENIYIDIEKKANDYIKDNFINIGRNKVKLYDFYFKRFGGIKRFDND